MKKTERDTLISLPILILLALGITLAGSQNGGTALGMPIFALAVMAIFLIQVVGFMAAYLLRTEAFFDLVGSITYISVTMMAVWLSPALGGRAVLLAILVGIWASRLGIFLFRRILRAGKDARFDEIKLSFVRFLGAWMLQGLWVTMTVAAALAAITSVNHSGSGLAVVVGVLIWAFGFAIETLADAQKNRFRADPANREEFIDTGLWAWSRHPNYFGEIMLWVGVAIIALPALQGWQHLTLISPVFVTLLLTRISGIPILEKRADAKWGGRADYERYKSRTPVLFPGLPASMSKPGG